jgi:type IV pilus assembly protein PilC
MLFSYKALTQGGETKTGNIEAIGVDNAIGILQKQGLIIVEISAPEEGKSLAQIFPFLSRVSNKDVVILSRQLATLFQAQVSALRIFRLLGEQVENKTLQSHLLQIADDIQGGSSISKALAKHPDP